MKNFKGFTLIELLVVISIIGVLSSVIFVSFSGSRDKARLAKAQNFDAQVSHALGAYAVGIWRFEEGTGTDIHDESGFGNDGTLGNGTCTPGNGSCPSWAIGQGVYSGTNALSFDGGDYVDTNYIPPTGSKTLSFWVYFNTVSTGNYQLMGVQEAADKYFYFGIANGGSAYGYAGNTGGTFAFTFSSGQWYHVVYFMDGAVSGTTKLYVNGEFKDSKSYTSNSQSQYDFYIGELHGSVVHYPFNGSIDNVSIYNEALSAMQIQQHYAAGAITHGIAINDDKR